MTLRSRQNKNQHKNLSMKEKRKKPSVPSRWSGLRHHTVERACGKHLLQLATKG